MQHAVTWQKSFLENMHHADDYDALSAGTKHTSEINPVTIKAMSHMGININNQKPKEVTEDMTRNAIKYFLSLENKEKNKHKN